MLASSARDLAKTLYCARQDPETETLHLRWAACRGETLEALSSKRSASEVQKKKRAGADALPPVRPVLQTRLADRCAVATVAPEPEAFARITPDWSVKNIRWPVVPHDNGRSRKRVGVDGAGAIRRAGGINERVAALGAARQDRVNQVRRGRSGAGCRRQARQLGPG